MDLATWKKKISEDLFRYEGTEGARAFFQVWRIEPGFRITFLMRTCLLTRGWPWTRYGVYHITKWLYSHICLRHGVQIDITTEIGGGLYLPHPHGIIINRRCKIGRDCNLSQNNTLGIANRGSKKGCPTVGDRVYIGPGAVVFGQIHIGDDAAIGANAVVNSDIPDNSVYAGIPAKQISMKGSEGYVNNTRSNSPDAPSANTESKEL